MSWIVSFEIIGDAFSPSKVGFNFDDQNEPDDIATTGRSKGSKYGYGSASYVVPDTISRLKTFKHLADTFEPLLPELRSCGAESWHISIGRLYFAQCNEELGSDDIVQIARLQCPLSYSAYSASEEEEKNGFRN